MTTYAAEEPRQVFVVVTVEVPDSNKIRAAKAAGKAVQAAIDAQKGKKGGLPMFVASARAR